MESLQILHCNEQFPLKTHFYFGKCEFFFDETSKVAKMKKKKVEKGNDVFI